MAKYRILSLDGGGIRGVLTATLLERLAASRPGFLDKIDLFAGTSTGGLLALGLAFKKSPAEIKALYQQIGAAIFADSFWDNVKDLGFAVGAQYSLGALKSELEAIFGTVTLGELEKKILITSFDLKDEQKGYWKPKIFHNYPGDDSDGSEPIVNVALRTSAAPAFFPIYQHYIDGGVVANNPSMCALSQALDRRVDPEHRAETIGEIVLFSLGTGLNRRSIDAPDGDWGWANWAVGFNRILPPDIRLPLIEILLEGHADLARFQCDQVLGKRFWRLNVDLPTPIGMDETDRMDELVELAMDTDLEPTVQWLDTEFD